MGAREEAGGDSEAHPTQLAVAGGHYLDQPEILHQRGTCGSQPEYLLFLWAFWKLVTAQRWGLEAGKVCRT